MKNLNEKVNTHLRKSGKFFGSIWGIFLATVAFILLVYVLNNTLKKPDIDAEIVKQVTELRNKYDTLWSSEGKSLSIEKKRLYEKQKAIDAQLTSYRQEIGVLVDKLTDKTKVAEWTPVSEQYYADNKEQLFYIAPVNSDNGTGGVSNEVTYSESKDLFYTCLKSYACRVTQSDSEHFANNGYLATDVGTDGKSVPVHLPDYMGKEVEYLVTYKYYPRTTGKTLELFGEYDGVKFMWRVGHIHDSFNGVNYAQNFEGKKAKTGQIVAYSGGEVENSFKNGGDQGATTGRHVHIEYLIWDGTKFSPAPYRIENKINVHKEKEKSILPIASAAELPTKNCKMFTVTAYYSPVEGQRRYITGSLAGDRKLNGNGTHGASGKEVFDGMVAAPKSYPFGTKIEMGGAVYHVEDRGGAIVTAGNRDQKYDRIDIWMGEGDDALDRSMKWGKRDIEGCFVS